ncbi:hypothetical protein [Streptomyces sp. TE5632]
MKPGRTDRRLLAGAAALAVLLGVAFCEHQDEDPPAPSCAAIAPAAQAGPTQRSGSSSRDKNTDRPPARFSKEPRPEAPVKRPAHPSKSRTAHGHRPHVDIDLELDGC